jgi:hypothetical protein
VAYHLRVAEKNAWFEKCNSKGIERSNLKASSQDHRLQPGYEKGKKGLEEMEVGGEKATIRKSRGEMAGRVNPANGTK